jgi:Sulfotransferase domain
MTALPANPRIAFCITCKGRLQHLRETLPKNLSDNHDYPNAVFVILDYASPDGLQEYLKEARQDERIAYYSFPTAGPFNMTHAKNMAHRCGIREGADILVNLDADNFTGPGFAQWIADQYAEAPKAFLWAKMIPGVLPRGINGRIAVTRHAFLNVGGYDEQYDTWSHDDKDFNLRLRRLGYSPRQIHPRFLDAIRHTDKMRFKEYPHAEPEPGYYEPTDYLMTSDVTIANFGRYGLGTVYRNFSSAPIELRPLPTHIFGIGMHKTATTSLHLALTALGFDSAHWLNAHWAKAIWSEMASFDRSLTLEQHYALCDIPIPMMFRALDRAYPGSKFILTHTSDEAWIRAAELHWSPKTNKWRSAWDADPFSHQAHKIIYGRKAFDREIFLARYQQHNREVRAYFKDRPQDILEMPMSDGAGWAELCPFVGVPVPNVPYPHGNKDMDLTSKHWLHAGDF